jgi:hypothetical protein
MARPRKGNGTTVKHEPIETVQSAGLGDTIEKITKATGIKAAVELFSSVTGLDCGCDERKETLNKLFPYRRVNCLSEQDYGYLKNFFSENRGEISVIVQRELSAIYKRIFEIDLEQTSCASCWRDYIGQIRKIYNEYGS